MKKIIILSVIICAILSGCDKNEKNEYLCTIEISAEVLNDKEVSENLMKILPTDGMILDKVEVIFFEGETVFDVLKRECINSKIHMEFASSVVEKTIYIEGISNIYEQDFGYLSGWMYSVNGVFPSVGVANYILSENDEILFAYTCDLGEDIGANRE